MNNRQNGRRRGRGGQQARNGQPGNADRGNRIDNRARGNAAQLLEKYKSLARDAQTQGDRVNTEYYLQYADHYFRVLSESRSRFEEQRPNQARRDEYRDEFGQDGDFDQDGQQGADGLGWNDGEDDRAEQPAPRRFERNDRGGSDRIANERGGGDRGDRNGQQRDVYAGGGNGANGGDESDGGNDSRSFEPRPALRPRRDRPNEGAPRAARSDGDGRAEIGGEPMSERIEIDRLPQGFAPTAATETDAPGEAPAPRRRAPRRPRGEATVSVDA